MRSEPHCLPYPNNETCKTAHMQLLQQRLKSTHDCLHRPNPLCTGLRQLREFISTQTRHPLTPIFHTASQGPLPVKVNSCPREQGGIAHGSVHLTCAASTAAYFLIFCRCAARAWGQIRPVCHVLPPPIIANTLLKKKGTKESSLLLRSDLCSFGYRSL